MGSIGVVHGHIRSHASLRLRPSTCRLNFSTLFTLPALVSLKKPYLSWVLTGLEFQHQFSSHLYRVDIVGSAFLLPRICLLPGQKHPICVFYFCNLLFYYGFLLSLLVLFASD